jgi:hypothetical protein
MDRNQLANDIAVGEEAERLLNNPIIKQYFMYRRAQLFENFRNTPAHGGDYERKEIHRTLKEVDIFEQHLLQAIQTGKMSEEAIRSANLIAKTNNLHKR